MLIFYQLLPHFRRRHLVIVVVVGVSLSLLASRIWRLIVEVGVFGVSSSELFFVVGSGVHSCGYVRRLLRLVGSGVLLFLSAVASP